MEAISVNKRHGSSFITPYPLNLYRPIASLFLHRQKYKKIIHVNHMDDCVAPQVGLEPTTTRLTAECSAIELLRNIGYGKELPSFPVSFLNPATSYSPGPFPAKYHQRVEA